MAKNKEILAENNTLAYIKTDDGFRAKYNDVIIF